MADQSPLSSPFQAPSSQPAGTSPKAPSTRVSTPCLTHVASASLELIMTAPTTIRVPVVSTPSSSEVTPPSIRSILALPSTVRVPVTAQGSRQATTRVQRRQHLTSTRPIASVSPFSVPSRYRLPSMHEIERCTSRQQANALLRHVQRWNMYWSEAWRYWNDLEKPDEAWWTYRHVRDCGLAIQAIRHRRAVLNLHLAAYNLPQ
ncbi:hypothetical protein K461DRAFT_272146 [Myriangium duriaei CBS 260.36]|uniref:Uncharacterized protein n=1 Tax=Myriangium duriaei CBS 260.36 TaxID=1168546 RepID=A0A9P4IUE7_9PEZI|nr:hypothetical protein K461DRAFT_272146 [Myriangium duriaei CBS 260.36]